MNNPVHVSTTIGELFDRPEGPPVRHPVVRSGERDPIPLIVRLSIYERDGRRCRECGLEVAEMELDHILPWSAGGGDHSANLRTLCKPCNQKRSNFQDVAEERLPAPTTWWCWHCWRHPDIEVDDPDIEDWGPNRRLRSTWSNGVTLSAAPFVTEPTERVYCAYCKTYSYSDVLFSDLMQQSLADLCATPAAAMRERLREAGK